jgi:hypothetical protein
MTRSMLVHLCTAALGAMLTASGAHASRLEQPEATAWRGSHGKVCVGCRIHDEAGRGNAPPRLDRTPSVMVAPMALNVCSDPGQSTWFPEEGEHLAAFLNSHSAEYK